MSSWELSVAHVSTHWVLDLFRDMAAQRIATSISFIKMTFLFADPVLFIVNLRLTIAYLCSHPHLISRRNTARASGTARIC